VCYSAVVRASPTLKNGGVGRAFMSVTTAVDPAWIAPLVMAAGISAASAAATATSAASTGSGNGGGGGSGGGGGLRFGASAAAQLAASTASAAVAAEASLRRPHPLLRLSDVLASPGPSFDTALDAVVSERGLFARTIPSGVLTCLTDGHGVLLSQRDWG